MLRISRKIPAMYRRDSVKNKFFINELVRFANIVLTLHTTKNISFLLSRIRRLWKGARLLK